MEPDNRTDCPIPHLGYCVYERCNFWDEAAQECTRLCLDDYAPLEEGQGQGQNPARSTGQKIAINQ
jgi:hypothetical protein